MLLPTKVGLILEILRYCYQAACQITKHFEHFDTHAKSLTDFARSYDGMYF